MWAAGSVSSENTTRRASDAVLRVGDGRLAGYELGHEVELHGAVHPARRQTDDLGDRAVQRSEAGDDGVIGGDAGGVRGDRAHGAAVDQHVGDAVVGIGGDGEALVVAVVDGHRPAWRDGAVRAGAGSDHVAVDGEARGDLEVGADAVSVRAAVSTPSLQLSK